MYPVLFKIGWFEAHAYGLLLMVSFLLGIYLAVLRGKKVGFDPNLIIDFSIVMIVSGLIGSRGMYVVYHLDEFRGRWLDIINPIQSDGTIGIAGLTVLGGILLCIMSGLAYLRYKKLPILPIFNVFAPSVALAYSIGRIGCFLHGCCFGTSCSYAWGLVFPPNTPAGFTFTEPIHPAQLYASFGGAISFALLLLGERFRFFKDKIFFIFLILFGVSRFIEDIFRYYEENMNLFHISGEKISVNQGISVLLIVIGIFGIVYLSRKNKSELFKDEKVQ